MCLGAMKVRQHPLWCQLVLWADVPLGMCRTSQMLCPKPSEFYVTATGGAIAASNVLFVGVGPLYQFGYGEIRAFARKALDLNQA